MRTFKDNAGRDWIVSIDVSAVKRIRTLVNVDVMEIVEGRLIERLIADPVLLADVLYSAVQPQTEAKGVTDEDFGRALGGDAIELATDALLREIIDFFPSRRRRLLTTALGKLREIETVIIDQAEAKLNSPTFLTEVEAEARRLGESSGNLPESSA